MQAGDGGEYLYECEYIMPYNSQLQNGFTTLECNYKINLDYFAAPCDRQLVCQINTAFFEFLKRLRHVQSSKQQFIIIDWFTFYIKHMWNVFVYVMYTWKQKYRPVTSAGSFG